MWTTYSFHWSYKHSRSVTNLWGQTKLLARVQRTSIPQPGSSGQQGEFRDPGRHNHIVPQHSRIEQAGLGLCDWETSFMRRYTILVYYRTIFPKHSIYIPIPQSCKKKFKDSPYLFQKYLYTLKPVEEHHHHRIGKTHPDLGEYPAEALRHVEYSGVFFHMFFLSGKYIDTNDTRHVRVYWF